MASSTVKCVNCNLVISELLAFVQNKADIMDEESIIRLCTTTFTEEEIGRAKKLLFEAVNPKSRRFITRKRDGKNVRNIEDILIVIKETEPELLPVYVARDLHKLPPVTFDHVDASKLLKDIIILQDEVTKIKENYATKEMLQMQDQRENVNCNKRGAFQLDSFNYESGPIGLPHIPADPFRSMQTQQNLNIDHIATNGKTADVVDIVNDTVVSFSHSSPTAATDSDAQATAAARKEEAGESGGAALPRPGSGRPAICVALTTSAEVPNSGNKAVAHCERKLMSDIVREGQWKADLPKDEWILVQRKRLKNNFVGMKGKADRGPDCKFKAAPVKIPFYIYNIDRETSMTYITEYIKSETSVDVQLNKVEMN